MSIRNALGIALALLLVAGAVHAAPPSVRVAYVSAGIPVDAGDRAWRQAQRTELALTPQIIIPPIGGGGVASVAVRAMHDGEWLGIRLEWSDATVDREVGAATFRDAVAVGFPVGHSDPLPSPFMGGEENPVAIWQWTADFAANAQAQGGFADRYPHTQGVWYFPQDAVVHREVKAWRGSDPVMEFVATGFGKLERRPTRNVQAQSSHARKRWTVLLRRRLDTGDPNDAPFRPGETTQLIVAVWNGSAGEVNGRKSVTLGWIPLVLDTTVTVDVRR